jgi:hypothetical protein
VAVALLAWLTPGNKQGIELSRTPMIRLPFFTLNDNNALEWEPNNRVLVEESDTHCMRVYGMDPHDGARQPGTTVAFEHGAFPLPGDSLFLPFNSLRWTPGSGDVGRVMERFNSI